MGLDTKRPPLPAPTEASTLDSADDIHHPDDVHTNVSTRTDKTSFSIPEDGSPITINTTKALGALHKKYPSQTSLLIEYFEGGKTKDSLRSRPSVRVRVTPSSRKNKSKVGHDHLQISRTNRHSRKPAYTRRISLSGKPRHRFFDSRTTDTSEVSFAASTPPVEIELLRTNSELSSYGGRFIPMASDVSSMPPDSMLGNTPQILAPRRRRSRSLEREADTESTAVETQDTLIAPKTQRSRSLSKDRITQRVMEKLQQQVEEAASSRSRESSSKPKGTVTMLGGDPMSPRKSNRRRSKDTEDISGTESSLLSSNADRRSGIPPSNRSAVSGTSSVNNPKLLATVEDAIRRLILPELNALKEENRTSRNREKFDSVSRHSGGTVDTTGSAGSRDLSRRVSKSSSAPKLHGSKPKVVLDADSDHPGIVVSRSSSRKGERRSSRGSISDRSYADSVSREERTDKTHRRKSKDKESTSSRNVAIAGAAAGAGLTAAALRHHTSREEKEEDRKHRKHRSSRSRTTSMSESVDQDSHVKGRVPPLPFNHSEMQSDLTRDSILSAETETKERPSSRSSRSTGIETPLNEVPRGYVSPSPAKRRTPSGLQRNLGTAHSNRSVGDMRLDTPKSDRSYNSRSREVTQASLEAAAAAKVRAIEQSETHQSLFEIESETPPRGNSPIQSEASYQDDVVTRSSPLPLRSQHSGVSISSLGPVADRPPSNMSIASLGSKPSTIAARTRKRPQGVTLESKRSILGDMDTPRDADEFFERNHEQNDMYRRELEDSSLASPANYRQLPRFTDDSTDGLFLDHGENTDVQDIGKVGLNPEYIHTPLAVESAVASLHDPSSISVRSSARSTPLKRGHLSQMSPSPAHETSELAKVPSGERWGAIRDKAEALALQSRAANSPRQSIARSIDETPQMHHSAFPASHDEMMPEIGWGLDNESDVTTNPSIIQGPLGGGDGYHDTADELLSRQEDRERTPTSFGKGAVIGAGAGAAAVAAVAAAHHAHKQSPHSFSERHQATVEDGFDQDYSGEHQYEQPSYARSLRTPSSGPAGWKDEGYQSANQREAFTPQNRNQPKLFEDDGFEDDYDDEADLFASSAKHGRQPSGNSHGMTSPLYDSATGKGMENIQSKDIVALMDHLTVRDAQRNARDTEILVTLVRSAAEMRNQLDEMRHFIKTQDTMIMQTTDKRAGLTEQRIMGGTRTQPTGSPRINRSASEDIDMETKKKNVFKRALKGLTLRGDSDIKNIEAMLVQLLGDVESLKTVQQLSMEQQNRSNSLTSYENLRASGDAGYEPEGRANTASSPNQSDFLSNPTSSGRRIQDLHSGYDVVPTNRVSTVQEVSDEEYDEHDRDFENTERMTTPTQEAFQNKQASLETPTMASRAVRDSYSQDNTPKRKHKSNSSSIFGIPKISRWSKTTSSTNPESLPRNSGSGEKPFQYSHSRSNSQVDVKYYDDEDDDEPYEVRDDASRRSSTSLAKNDRASIRSARSPSPLVPEEYNEYEMEDPKYQAHRNSLNLQHPQPRAGPTGRHQNHLETQAQIYEPVHSPDHDQWGSMPALARNRMSGPSHSHAPGNLSPISSDGGYSGHSASEQQMAPPRPPKIQEEGPLIPPQQPLAGYGQTRQMYSSTNEFGSQGALTPLAPIAEVRYSLETDRGHRVRPFYTTSWEFEPLT